MLHRITQRATFAALARARTVRRGPLVVSHLPGDPGEVAPRVGFAVGRGVGGAVVRNRVRRRLRAACREQIGDLRPGGAYLVRALPEAATTSYRDLAGHLGEAVRALHGSDPARSPGHRAGRS